MPLEFRCVFLCNTHSSPTRAKNPAKAPAYACELCIFLSCVHTSKGPHKLHAYIPVCCGKSPTAFSENRRIKWGVFRIFSETPPEGICHGVILRNLIHSFVYFLFLSLSAPFPAISPGHPRHLHVLCSFIQDRLLLRSYIKKSCDQHGIFCRIKTRPDAVCTTHDVFFLFYSIVVLP